MAVALGGSHSAYSGSAASLASGVFAVQPTAGSTIVVAVGWQWNSSSAETVTSVTDNASGNTYTRIGTQVEDNTNGYRVVLYRAYNINTVASFNVTANMTATESDVCVYAIEIKGANTSDPNGVYVGQSQQNPGTATDAVTTGSAGTPASDGHFVLCATMSDTNASMTAGTGYTSIGSTPTAFMSLEYLIQTTAAGVTGTWTASDAAGDYSTAVASFSPAGGAAATLEQEGFRWYNDDGSESASTAAASQDTSITAAAGQTRRIRMLLNATGDPATTQYKLQYKLSTDGTWSDIA